MLKKKRITFIISGGIAAYKICQTVSDLTKKNYSVTCVLTKTAKNFVTPLTLKTLSGNEVYTDLFEDSKTYDGVLHIDLAQKTDIIVVAPATANIIAKFANGISDDLATSVLIATDKPILVFPAMNDVMYNSFQNIKNINTLVERGIKVFDPDKGLMACGTIGIGRLPSKEIIKWEIYKEFNLKKDLKGKSILINAGATKEKIDPARCITNYSSGEMGLKLAENATLRGANVTLILGDNSINVPEYINYINAFTTKEMKEEMEKRYEESEMIIFCAAVSDFVPEVEMKSKIKKKDTYLLKLVKNIDIAKYFADRKKEGKIHVGFSLETDKMEDNAFEKMHQKKFDYIIANSPNGLGEKENSGVIISSKGKREKIEKTSKFDMADKIFNFINTQGNGE